MIVFELGFTNLKLGKDKKKPHKNPIMLYKTDKEY